MSRLKFKLPGKAGFPTSWFIFRLFLQVVPDRYLILAIIILHFHMHKMLRSIFTNISRIHINTFLVLYFLVGLPKFISFCGYFTSLVACPLS